MEVLIFISQMLNFPLAGDTSENFFKQQIKVLH